MAPRALAAARLRIGRALATAGLVAAGFVALLAACGSEPIPPLPADLRGMTEQEASCIACHSRGLAPSLAPGETRTPSAHPTFDPEAVRTLLGDR